MAYSGSEEVRKEKIRFNSKRWRSNNLEKRRAWERSYYAKNREKRLIVNRNWAKNNPEKKKASLDAYRSANFEKRGLPVPTRDRPFLCELCGCPQTGRKRFLCLDNCHETKQFRGWLCNKCNVGLGLFKDDLSILLKAVEYLKRSMS